MSNTTESTVHEFYLSELPGDGRGTIFWNHEPTKEEMFGMELIDYEGYDDEDDDDWDDFGYQYYSCTVVGTNIQVMKFIDEYFYGQGNVSKT